MNRALGQIAFETHRDSVFGGKGKRGKLKWEIVSSSLKKAWEKTAQTVLDHGGEEQRNAADDRSGTKASGARAD